MPSNARCTWEKTHLANGTYTRFGDDTRVMYDAWRHESPVTPCDRNVRWPRVEKWARRPLVPDGGSSTSPAIRRTSAGVKVHHLALGARDVLGVAAFYRDAFRLPELTRHHHGDGTIRSVWLGLDEAVLMIEACSDMRAVEGVGAGLFLLAFEVDEAERAQLEQRLLALGGSIDQRAQWTTFARDPEGNRVAISHYPLDELRASKRVPAPR